MKKDCYELLEVTQTATETEIKKSYRRLAMCYHPDKNPGNAEAEMHFKEISVAYEILSDPQKRSAYDRYGHAAFENGGAGGGFEGFDFGNLNDMFADIFSDFFGGSQRRGNPNAARRGQDLQYSMEISLEEAFRGIKKEIKIPTKVKCDDCNGVGGEGVETCPHCHGRGKIVQSAGGFFMMESICPKCKGKGKIIINKCKTCGGSGLKQEEKTIELKIPAGVETQTQLRISGAGEAGLNGGSSGDLYVVIFIKEHKIYKRKVNDLYIQIPISMTSAALGDKVEVKGIDGDAVFFEIEEGTQNGSVQKIKHHGMSIYDSAKRGDLYVEFLVSIPKTLNTRQKELLEEFKSLEQEENKGFFESLKDFLKVG